MADKLTLPLSGILSMVLIALDLGEVEDAKKTLSELLDQAKEMEGRDADFNRWFEQEKKRLTDDTKQGAE